MTSALSQLKYVRISPQKARLVADLVRGKKVDKAIYILQYSTKKAGKIIKKAIEAAVSNAENNYGLDVDRLYVTKLCVDRGPMLKRVSPRAKGRADRIMKRTSHITVIVGEKIV